MQRFAYSIGRTGLRVFCNYPYFGEEGEVNALLENANDGDLNFRFVGTTGTYTMDVDLYNLTVEIRQ